MEDKIFEMVIESMKQKLIFSDMVEMRKIVKGAVRMMEAHYEAKMPSGEEMEHEACNYVRKHYAGGYECDSSDDYILKNYNLEIQNVMYGMDWLKSQLTNKSENGK